MMRITLLFVLLGTLAYGQNPEPCFEPNVTGGCAPLRVTLTDCSGAEPGNILYDYGTGAKTTATSFTYDEPGTYAITQYIGSGTGGDSLRRENLIMVREGSPITATTTGCPDQGVLLELNDSDYDQYTIRFGDGTEVLSTTGDTALVHYYNDTAPRTIQVQGGFDGGAGNCPVTELDFIPTSNPAALTTQRLEILDESRLRLTLSDTVLAAGYELEQQVGNGNFALLQTLDSGTHQIELDGLDLANQTYSYRISQTDPCTNTRTTDTPIRTNFLRGSVGNGTIGLNWAAQPVPDDAFVAYEIQRDEAPLDSLSTRGTTSYVDANVTCRRTYCYRVIAHLIDDRQSISQEICQTAELNRSLHRIDSTWATVNAASQVELRWAMPDDSLFNTVLFARSGGGSVADTLTSTNTDLVLDGGVAGASACYQTAYTDACGNSSPFSSEVCTIYLEDSNDTLEYVLNWNNYVGGFEGLRYALLKMDNERNVLDSIAPSGTSYTGQVADETEQTLLFRVVATGVNTGNVYGSNTVRLSLPSNFLIPNAFSPNNDGLNDTFGATGRFIESYTLRIFTSWGSPVFVSESLEDRWDGTQDGSPVPSGTYFYQVNATDQIGRSYNIRDVLTVIR